MNNDEGSYTNAFRHTLWQAKITSSFNSDIARAAGNAHEKNPYTNTDWNFNAVLFTDINKVDEMVDIMNNIIGRSIGGESSDMDMKDLSSKILDHFKVNGLWAANEVKNEKGEVIGYKISRTQLTQTQYESAKRNLDILDNDGFTQNENEVRNRR
ncbi:hypothetical protein [Dysgonomonas sp.]|uniref:DUF6973 domain-containing protein n=1 Tax=Dysgonomonas sp. TaxID=1891233 RepID=UPI00282CA2E7|nr:hypothetical protein [Dysgonomonas sp.]MDR2004402.1 hypothetical protein [Prevotella sp.]HMM05040.1 hypothetical protein [Dysgonomonas sp.]